MYSSDIFSLVHGSCGQLTICTIFTVTNVFNSSTWTVALLNTLVNNYFILF